MPQTQDLSKSLVTLFGVMNGDQIQVCAFIVQTVAKE